MSDTPADGDGGGDIVIYLPDLSGGGAERLHVQLAREFIDMGLRPRFLLDRRAGALIPAVPRECPIDSLDAPRQMAALPKLVRYLRRARPAVLIANMEHMNVMALVARGITRVPTRIIVTQHNALSEQVKRRSWQWRALPALYRATLPMADAIVAVSAGVADDLAALTGIDRRSVTVIHNGVVTSDFGVRSMAEPRHPWFSEGRLIVLGMGRLVAQKDFGTLIRSFAPVARTSDARLVILGEGPERDPLEALVAELGLADRVSLPGFVDDPLPWLKQARLFVLSSRFEGFGNVLAEALACGTPVVSTDCPSGPSEIVEGGRYGTLVPVGDAEALGTAIRAQLEAVPDHAMLEARGRHFSTRSCAENYRALISGLRAR